MSEPLQNDLQAVPAATQELSPVPKGCSVQGKQLQAPQQMHQMQSDAANASSSTVTCRTNTSVFWWLKNERNPTANVGALNSGMDH